MLSLSIKQLNGISNVIYTQVVLKKLLLHPRAVLYKGNNSSLVSCITHIGVWLSGPFNLVTRVAGRQAGRQGGREGGSEDSRQGVVTAGRERGQQAGSGDSRQRAGTGVRREA